MDLESEESINDFYRSEVNNSGIYIVEPFSYLLVDIKLEASRDELLNLLKPFYHQVLNSSPIKECDYDRVCAHFNSCTGVYELLPNYKERYSLVRVNPGILGLSLEASLRSAYAKVMIRSGISTERVNSLTFLNNLIIENQDELLAIMKAKELLDSYRVAID